MASKIEPEILDRTDDGDIIYVPKLCHLFVQDDAILSLVKISGHGDDRLFHLVNIAHPKNATMIMDYLEWLHRMKTGKMISIDHKSAAHRQVVKDEVRAAKRAAYETKKKSEIDLFIEALNSL